MFEGLTEAFNLALGYGVIILSVGVAVILLVGAAKRWISE